jgi:hypothetical protein
MMRFAFFFNINTCNIIKAKTFFVQIESRYWVFEGQDSGQYSARSVQQILRNGVEKAKINPLEK